ncbi:MAG: DUF3443 domain-containing protein [Proteobacteria bacterium]|nr:DUF3443 domain-containing protein [Pseudomonadota bacterium]
MTTHALRNRLLHGLLAASVLIQGCGGGGGGNSTSTATGTTSTSGTNTVVAAASNVQPISVNSGLGGTVNLAFTSITLCAPGSNNCQTVDNILIDTGSSGLRVMASALPASLSLPQQKDAFGNPLVECAHFVDGYTWGPVKQADLRIAGERANSLAVQVIGDSTFPLVPRRCAATGPSKNSASTLRANGILGLAIFPQDCGDACATSGSPGIYYICPATGCQTAAVPLAQQLQNPVTLFASNNNGVIVELPSAPGGVAASLAGSLVFGIGTQANNGLGGATVIGVDADTANFTTVYNGATFSASFIDSGSNALFFPDAGTPVCTDPAVAGFFCPSVTKNLTATIQGRNGKLAAVGFGLANASEMVRNNPGFAVFGNLGAPQLALGSGSFDWGLPFFYGRNVYVAITGANTPAGTGPYVAF